MAPLSNDDLSLVPRTEFDGEALSFDLPGMEVGVAEYEEGPTGCTVFHFPDGVLTTMDVRGGMVGKTGDYDWNHAICFAGGSLLGLEAATGVTAELFARREHSLAKMPLVSGAIIFDFGVRDNTIYPDRELGRAALRAAQPGTFPVGRRGAGRSATVGKLGPEQGEPGGQGAAFRRIGEARLLVCTVVNALGAVVDRDGQVVRGSLDKATGDRVRAAESLERRIAQGKPSPGGRPENTTLTLLATNARLDQRTLAQVGKQVHASMARAIEPFHTLSDGDVLYAVTTAQVDSDLSPEALGIAASELAWDAVLAAVRD